MSQQHTLPMGRQGRQAGRLVPRRHHLVRAVVATVLLVVALVLLTERPAGAAAAPRPAPVAIAAGGS